MALVQCHILTYAVESPGITGYLPVSRGVSMSRQCDRSPKEVACQTCRQAFLHLVVGLIEVKKREPRCRLLGRSFV